jgi:hypothetical protein
MEGFEELLRRLPHLNHNTGIPEQETYLAAQLLLCMVTFLNSLKTKNI